ncbi:CARDB domain-containing protein [Halolamina sp. C58]|uniref:CARDB domain-containing protein n=1 Tax=Halolamina sp. C58 TaxID=3421640 RepID=UPI003EB82E52
MHRAVAVAVVLLLAGVQPATAVTAGGADASSWTAHDAERAVDSAASPTIAVDTVLSLTPQRPGSIGVVQTFEIPAEVTELRVTLDPQSNVTDADGFSHVDGQTWAWDGETAAPRLRYGMAANRTTDRDGPMGADGSYLYADVGQWALVQQPNLGYQWRYRGADSISVDRTTRVDGAGAVGETTAFLGAHTTYTRAVAEQEITLIVPEAASLADPPEEILDGLGNASQALHVGDRDPTVFAVAAPTDRVNWAAQGIQVGDTDFWVRAPQSIDDVGNAWLHEYVHTRQSFRTADSGRWVTEASATWYAALLSHRHEGVSFARFTEFLDRGTNEPQASSVLADPTDWANNANYWKGALVTGEIDRRIRVATDRGATFQRVLASLNERTSPITNEDVLAAVADAGGQSTRTPAERLTTTSDAPEVWNRSAHREAFGGDAALLRVEFDPATDVRATGPYRNATLSPPVTLAAGETLSLRTAVENLGGASGEYAVTLRVDDRTVATANGTLAPGERTAVSLTHEFEEPGRYTVSIAGERLPVAVREPATPTVTDLAVEPRTVEPGGETTVTATVANDGQVPGNATIPFTRNGETVTTRTVTLGPGERETVSATVELPAAGEYRVGAGGRAVDVRAVAPTTETTTPGFGVPVAIVAVLAALGLRRSGS